MIFKKVKTVNVSGALSRIQDNVVTSLNAISDKKIIDGILLINISLDSTKVNNINHGLGRPISGWIIVRKRAASDIWDSQDSNVTKTKTLALNCSSNVIIDIWIF